MVSIFLFWFPSRSLSIHSSLCTHVFVSLKKTQSKHLIDQFKHLLLIIYRYFVSLWCSLLVSSFLLRDVYFIIVCDCSIMRNLHLALDVSLGNFIHYWPLNDMLNNADIRFVYTKYMSNGRHLRNSVRPSQFVLI